MLCDVVPTVTFVTYSGWAITGSLLLPSPGFVTGEIYASPKLLYSPEPASLPRLAALPLLLFRCWSFWPVRTQGSVPGQAPLAAGVPPGPTGHEPGVTAWPPYGKSGSTLAVWDIPGLTINTKPHSRQSGTGVKQGETTLCIGLLRSKSASKS